MKGEAGQSALELGLFVVCFCFETSRRASQLPSCEGGGASQLRSWVCSSSVFVLRRAGGPVSFRGCETVRRLFLFWGGRGAIRAVKLFVGAQDCCLNPAAATGLLRPFLRHTQDCPDAAPARIMPSGRASGNSVEVLVNFESLQILTV